MFKALLVLIHCKKITEKNASSLTTTDLNTGPAQFENLQVDSCSSPQQVPGEYRKLTAIIPSSFFPMHYSLITLLWEATESALPKAIFINHTHTYEPQTLFKNWLFPCDRIIGNDMGRACGTYGEKKHLQGFGGETGKKGPILMT